MPVSQTYHLPAVLERERNITLKEGAKLAGVSEDTLRRRYPHLLRRVSPKRLTIKVGHALDIGEALAESKTEIAAA
jgi:hypothetical protein